MSDQKLDTTKRRTIKILGAAPMLSMPIVGLAASTAASAAAGVKGPEALSAGQTELINDKLPAANPRTSMAVEIHIINSTFVPENSVLIRNTTDEPLHITRFMPGHIIFDGKHMDLNVAMGSQPLSLAAGQSKAFLFDIASADKFRQIEYVWADHAVDKLSEQTSVVTLGAFMANTDAVVYANTKQYVPS